MRRSGVGGDDSAGQNGQRDQGQASGGDEARNQVRRAMDQDGIEGHL